MDEEMLRILRSRWQGMIARCHYERHTSYARYGAKGITVCERWRHCFEAFVEDMGPMPTREHSLDRIDNERGYEPGNVRWATASEQARNKRNNHRLSAFGRTMTVTDWSAETGLSLTGILGRLDRGHTPEMAVGVPANALPVKKADCCGAGHEFTPENTKRTRRGFRKCRQCDIERCRRLRARESLTPEQRRWLEFAAHPPDPTWAGVIPTGSAQFAMAKRLAASGLVELVGFGRNETRERVDDHREQPIYRITDAGLRALGGEEGS